jgi:cytochrome c biogenesis protein CcdA
VRATRPLVLDHPETLALVAAPCVRVRPMRVMIRKSSVRTMSAMLRRIGVAISVGLADSINPSTLGPALYLATIGRAVLRITQFTTGIFVVNFAAGVVLVIGPGRNLLDLVPNPKGTVRDVIELVAGVVLLSIAVALWLGRRKLARHPLPRGAGGRSALVAGASIAAAELPTAVPYFAVIGGIVGSNATLPEQILLVAIYNLCFVAPILAIAGALLLMGQRALRWLDRGAAWLQRRWPVAMASLLMLVGSILTILGGSGLLKP